MIAANRSRLRDAAGRIDMEADMVLQILGLAKVLESSQGRVADLRHFLRNCATEALLRD